MTDEEKKLNEAIKQDGIETQSEILEELKRRYPQYAEQSDNEKEIGRITKVLSCEKCHLLSWDCPKDQELHCAVYEEAKEQATQLLNVGIGDKKQVVKEFIERAKSISGTVMTIAGTKVSAVLVSKLNELFNELYGVEE